MLSKQEEDRERRETLLNDQRVLGIVAQDRELTDAQRGALEKKLDEAKRTSTLMAHANEEIPGRFNSQSKSQITGATPAQQWPKQHEYWAWANMGQSPSFGQQMTEFGVSQTSVQEKRR
jgi:hypothetical protein